MPDISQKVIAPFGTPLADGRAVGIDLNSFVMRLLLFEHYTIETVMLKDVAKLSRAFGVDGLIELLKSGIVSIHMDALTTGQMNREDPLRGNASFPTVGSFGGEFLPLMHYDPVILNMADRQHYIHQCLTNLTATKAPAKKFKQLKNATLDALTEVPSIDGPSNLWASNALMQNNAVITQITESKLREMYGKQLTPSAFDFNFRRSGEYGYAVESNFQQVFGLTEMEVHKLFEAVILATGGFYQRLAIMQAYESIAWFNETDAKVLDAELKVAAQLTKSNTAEASMVRVLELKELPVLEEGSHINITALMNLRNSKECKEFREWLKSSTDKSDEAIKHELTSFKAAFANFLNTGTTRVARFVLNTALSAKMPVAGIAIDVGQQFIIDKILPANGPIAFINNKLPPIWTDNPYKS
jgi:hypothetical protein